MATSTEKTSLPLAKRVAPDDLLPGQYVAVLHLVFEYPSYLWMCEGYETPIDQPVRVTFRPCFSEHEPLRVLDVCLPFVFVADPRGGHRVLDVRSHQLVTLDKGYSKRVWRALKKKRKKRS